MTKDEFLLMMRVNHAPEADLLAVDQYWDVFGTLPLRAIFGLVLERIAMLDASDCGSFEALADFIDATQKQAMVCAFEHARYHRGKRSWHPEPPR